MSTIIRRGRPSIIMVAVYPAMCDPLWLDTFNDYMEKDWKQQCRPATYNGRYGEHEHLHDDYTIRSSDYADFASAASARNCSAFRAVGVAT